MPRPTPKSHEVLIRIHATIAAAADFKLHSSKTPTVFSLFGPKQPKPIFPGQDLAGEIEAVGRKVTRFRKGDQVIGWSGIRLGTYAEYTCLPERGVLFIKPANMTYEESATLPVAGLDTANLLRRANIRPGEQVLINGAGGNMGTYAVQIARHLGAEVTGVDSTAKLNMLRSIGADHVIDYTQEDFNQSGKTYDVIFDVIGNRSISIIMERLNPNGRYLTAVPLMSQIIRWQLSGRRSGKKIIFWAPRTLGGYTVDFAFLKGLIEGGSVRAIIDRCFPLEQTAEATRYVESGHKLGHVVITVAQDPIQQTVS
ncbi:MAG TPA: NAD(P)-dependent alcohol dehydrogenase [Anaerolineales bacterium]|nr:NAD(P)-dependent alcohol dehydrogenase [Anaerolineales bacterium]